MQTGCKFILRFLLVTGLAGFAMQPCVAQKAISLHIISKDSLQKKEKKLLPQKQFATQPDAMEALQGLLYNCFKQGYLAASIDSVVKDSANVTAWFVLGKQYKMVKLHKGNLDKYLINGVG
ncbi:MAG: hypothetical protein WCL06_13390, partial [Bacteroidota bacterium]